MQVAFVESVAQSGWGPDQTLALEEVAASKDPWLAWLISDLLRFVTGPELNALLASAASDLFGKDLRTLNAWGVVTDHLIAWDIPAAPDYLEAKRSI